MEVGYVMWKVATWDGSDVNFLWYWDCDTAGWDMWHTVVFVIIALMHVGPNKKECTCMCSFTEP